MRMTHILCVALTAILTMAFLNPVEAASSRDGAPPRWSLVIRDEQGQVMAASGRDASKVPVALTVATLMHDESLRRSTTYVRGRSALRIDRVYSKTGVLDITYEGGGERLTFSLQRDEATGEGLAVYTLPDGRIYTLWTDAAGSVVTGDVEGLRSALQGDGGVLKMLRRYAKDVSSFGSSVAEARIFVQLRWPDQPCVDACSMGCTGQCAWECTLSDPTCRVCMTACGIGCFIGCAGSL